MVIRDFLTSLRGTRTLEAVLLLGPRQVGKTTLLNELTLGSRLYFDDLSLRNRAHTDPALVLEGARLPCLLDEAQYAPNLFPEIKLRIDGVRREKLKTGSTEHETLFYITGSNRTLLDGNVKESLAGRSHVFYLLGFSLKEINTAFPNIALKTILMRGGFPELYTRPELNLSSYLNDYITSFVEKDVAASAGVEKIGEFHTVLRLLAARTGQFLNVSEVSNTAGVNQKTVQSWINLMQRNLILEELPTFASNLSKRIVKMPKLFFYDTGLCARLQGHLEEEAMWNSPQSGALFETLVFGEIMKTKLNFLKDWALHAWRTKEKKEIDFVLQMGKKTLFIEAKMAIHGAQPFSIDSEARKVFTPPYQKTVVTAGGQKTHLDKDTLAVPVRELPKHLLETM